MHNATAEVKLASGKSRRRSTGRFYSRFCYAGASNPQIPTILLVEDEAFVREVAGEILGSAGYHVLQSGNAAEAVRAFRDRP